MQFILISLISIVSFGFITSFTIMSSAAEYDDFIDFGDDINDVSSMENISPYASLFNVFETLYTKETIGKSHRFYFTAGERQDGDKLLGHLAKQAGWKSAHDAVINVTYPADNKSTQKLTFVLVKVIQESDINRIYVSDGGIDKTNIGITIVANQTRYLTYNATFYGI